MEDSKFLELEAMILVIYKRLDKIEREAKGSHRFASDSVYLEELRAAAIKVRESLEKQNKAN